MKLQNLIHILIGTVCLTLLPRGQAVVPPPLGGYPNFTTAAGDHALQALTLGLGNTAIGTYSMFSVTTGNFNTAVGAGSLDLNTEDSNTAVGAGSLLFNTSGTQNTATGTAALEHNDSGNLNTANGAFALYNNTTGSGNIALGVTAGVSVTNGNNNIDIGNAGDATDSDTIRMGNSSHGRIFIPAIHNIVLGAGVPVTIDSTTGLLGLQTSSRRFKEDIKPMDQVSEALFDLKPVTFCYKNEIDPAGISQFGLVAEEVEKVNRDLVVRDKDGKPYSVRYEAVNAMLLNEFLKAHHKVQEQEATIAWLTSSDAKQEAMIANQQKQIEALSAGLQKVSAQLEASKPAPQVVNNP